MCGFENVEEILNDFYDADYTQYQGMKYDDAREILEKKLDASDLELVEKNNPPFFLLRQKAWVLSAKIYKLYKSMGVEKILEKYQMKTNIRGSTVTSHDFAVDIDVNASRSLAKYALVLSDPTGTNGDKVTRFAYKDMMQFKKNYGLELEFKGPMWEVNQDLVQYIRNDFQINLMARTKYTGEVKVQNYHYKYIISESIFHPENFLGMIIREFVRPYVENQNDLNQAFMVWLSKPHLLSYIGIFDNFLALDPNLRDKVYKFFLESPVLKEQFFTWIYYVIFTLYQFVLNKIYHDKEWGVMYSKYLLCTGIIINLLQTNPALKEMMQDTYPKIINGPAF